jgi:hypothetical protein
MKASFGKKRASGFPVPSPRRIGAPKKAASAKVLKINEVKHLFLAVG